MRGTIVVAGSLAQKPGCGGHTWVFLQYLLGFRRLGWDVLFVDWLGPGMCDGARGRARSVSYLLAVMSRFGLADSFALLDERGHTIAGLARAEVLRRAGSSALLLNVMGYLGDEDVLGRASMRAFLDIDPGFGQMWRELGLHDPFRGYDAYVTIGANIGQASCSIPTCGLPWITTRQPVVLEHWPQHDSNGGAFTSVCTWRGPLAPVEYDGKTFGLRAHEFRKFAELPSLTKLPFELALDIDAAEVPDLTLLDANGWLLVDPHEVAGDPFAYKSYIAGSKAEFMVAKGMYVSSCSGWFSDRSSCYLASGRPVLAQDTGLGDLASSGEGLVVFRTLEEALAGVEEICGDYARHARAARALAEDVFDSDTVLGELLARLGVN